jgi:NADP-dependent 3-hydroxy acid dehydrogenase YdfG
MRTEGSGVIVTIPSLAGRLAAFPTQAAYAGNKLVPRQQSLQIIAASLGLLIKNNRQRNRDCV